VTDTIIGVAWGAPPPLRSMIHCAPEDDGSGPDELSRLFKIRSANTYGQRSSASVLINRMYATRGYRTGPMPLQQLPERITLTASEHDDTIGTITVGFDSDAGLHVDEVFPEETDALRRAGRRICEFTKLAMDSVVQSKRVLASLFHVAYIYAHRLMHFDDLLIEVNPRHVRYYERMLGFEALGKPRLNPRVDAPAVLMRLRFSHAHEEINKFGGWAEYSTVERSLYPLFFSVAEEASIIGRLHRLQPDSVYSPESAKQRRGDARATSSDAWHH
jgi:hypothetical protein